MNLVRYLKNPYPDFDGTQYLSNDQQSLVPNTENFIKQQLKRLFEYWENNLKQFDSSDITVYTGLTGAAILYIKLYESQIFTNNDYYLQKSFNLVQNALKNFRKIRVATFMCGEIGLLTMSVIVNNYMGQNYNNYLQHIVSLEELVCNINSDLPDEILYGRAGYLYSLLLIRSKIPNCKNVITDNLIRHVITSILNSGIETSRKQKGPSPLMYFWYNEPYVGAAHGYAGILYMLLEAADFITQDEMINLIKPTIDYVCCLQYPNTANFPACIGDNDDMLVHWCHGSPGVIHLLILAYRVFNEVKYLNIAIVAAEDIWKRGLLKKGYGLCHGAAGNAYAFLRLFSTTNDEKYLYRAVKFAEWCCDYGSHGCRTPDTPFSLFEGMAGTLYYLIDVLNPYQAKFPAFQLT